MKNRAFILTGILGLAMLSCQSGKQENGAADITDSLLALKSDSPAEHIHGSDTDCCTEKAKTTAHTKAPALVSGAEKAPLSPAIKLRIYAFHGTRQCTTCKNMKSNTKEALNTYFSKELKSGEIEYFVIDVDAPENEAIAEKFEATGTALMVNTIKDGKEQISDWSEFAFDEANDPESFIPGIKERIEKALKSQ